MALLNYPFRFVGGWVLMALLGITDTSICQQSNTVVVELCYDVRQSSDCCCLPARSKALPEPTQAVFSRAPAAAHRDGVVKNGSLQPATLGWSWPEKKTFGTASQDIRV